MEPCPAQTLTKLSPDRVHRLVNYTPKLPRSFILEIGHAPFTGRILRLDALLATAGFRRPPDQPSRCPLAASVDFCNFVPAASPSRPAMSIRVALHHRTEYRYDRPSSSARRSSACGRRPIAARRSQLFAEGRARRALSQLAAGSVRQLSRAARVQRAGRPSSSVEVDLHRPR